MMHGSWISLWSQALDAQVAHVSPVLQDLGDPTFSGVSRQELALILGLPASLGLLIVASLVWRSRATNRVDPNLTSSGDEAEQ